MARTQALTITKGTLSNKEPTIGRVSIPTTIDFSAADDVTFDFTQVEQQQLWSPARSVYINNSANPSPITVKVSQTADLLIWPPFSAGCLPLVLQPGSTIEFVSAGGVQPPNVVTLVTIEFYNYDVSPFMYAGFAPFVSGSSVVVEGRDGATPMSDTNPLVTEPVGSNPTNASATLVAATATPIVAASAVYRNIRFRNMGDAAGNLYPATYCVGAAATGAFPHDKSLPANGLWEVLPYRTNQLLSVYCAGGAAQIEAEYW